MKVEAPHAVVCTGCGETFALSARNVREQRRTGREPFCRACRYPAKQPDPAEVQEMRRYWLDRFTLDELLELGRELGWR